MKRILYCRYNCFLCDFDLCDACASREAGKLKGKALSAMSLRLPGSRRSSTNRPLHYSSRRSSHAIHPANLQDHRRLSAVSQNGPHTISRSSSRKSSRCDERCLSRRSSNIQHKVTVDKIAIKNASQNNLSQNIENSLVKKENIVTVNNEQNKTCKKEAKDIEIESKVNLNDLKDIVIEETKILDPEQNKQKKIEESKSSMKKLIPVKPSRGDSSSNLLQKATGHPSPRRSSIVSPSEATTQLSPKDILGETNKEELNPCTKNLIPVKPSQGESSSNLIQNAPTNSSLRRPSYVLPEDNGMGSNTMTIQEKNTTDRKVT